MSDAFIVGRIFEMKQNKLIRVVKRGQKELPERPAGAPGEQDSADDARRMKTVISGWVREHRQRSDEFWQTYTTRLEELGFRPRRV